MNERLVHSLGGTPIGRLLLSALAILAAFALAACSKGGGAPGY
jgi:hypothetical protein